MDDNDLGVPPWQNGNLHLDDEYSFWLVVSNIFIFHFMYGMSSFPLTNSIIFQDDKNHQPGLVKCD